MAADDFNIKYSDLKPLFKIFDSTTNSYKFLFFLSLLDIIQDKDDEAPIAFDNIAVGMLYRAWYPHSQHRLSFGERDQVTGILDEFENSLEENVRPADAKRSIAQFLTKNPNYTNDLMQYVPYRLIRSFTNKKLVGLEDQRVNHRVQEMSAKYLYEGKYPYTLSKETKTLTFNHYWLHYFKNHFHILQGWASWHWAQYMQKRNPAVPAIPAKLHPLLARPPISNEIREYWRSFMGQQNGLSCIFSGREVTAGHFALDHFLPWHFVAHNQAWNLIPIDPDINASKSDKIPSMGEFLQPFVEQQYKFLSFINATKSEEQFGKLTKSYVLDLGMRQADLLNKEQLLGSYQSHLEPLASLALNQGFQPFQFFAATQ